MGWLWMPQNLNTVLGGYIALSKFLEENKLEPSISLPNKFNAAVINAATHTGSNNDAPSAAHQAIKNSSRVPLKLQSLLVIFSTTKMTNLAIMINSTSGGRKNLAPILPFQTHQIHGSNLTV